VTGNVKEARLHYERALQLNPNHELARENLRQLDEGKSDNRQN
jgi:Flp pilus assembly protein TadD